MNRIFAILGIILITGCSSCELTDSVQSDACFDPDIRRFQISQALVDGALAYDCSERIGNNCRGQQFFIYEEDNDYYDGQFVRLEWKKCLKRNGVYRYITMKDVQRTVPLLFIEDRSQKNQ